LLEALFIFQPLPAWSTNISKRLVKSHKVHLLDSGLTAHLRGETDARALLPRPGFGALLETFIVQEIRRLLTWDLHGVRAYHLRTATGLEVDMVLEAPGQRVVGIEVKASARGNAA
jgi:predicted AAA+ superfamily ATPase